MAERAVARGDDDLEKIGPDCEMRWNSEDVNHHRHSDVTGATAEETAEQAADEGDQDDDPKRDRFHAGSRERDHRPKAQPLDRCGPVADRRLVLFRGGPRCFAASTTAPLVLK